MEFLLDNLGANKVVLDIKTNNYEETYDYRKEVYARFNEIEDILSMYKDTLKQPLPSKALQSNPSDPFLYKILLFLDPTLSLIGDKNVFIDKFRGDLQGKLRNYEEKLKKYGFDTKDVLGQITNTKEERTGLYRYIAILLEKSLAVESNGLIILCEVSTSDKCVLIDENVQEITIKECKQRIRQLNKENHIKNNTIAKLDSLLVKDLKEIADDLGVSLYEVDSSGKKKALLKAELKDKIKSVLI